MTELQRLVPKSHARLTMPRPPYAAGPWGEAIRYWLKQSNWLQADLARKTKLPGNTISRACRGLHVTTRILEKIALAFTQPLDAILVSPERRVISHERERLILDITRRVVSTVDEKMLGANPLQASFLATDQAARELEKQQKHRKTSRRGVRNLGKHLTAKTKS